MPWNAAGRRGLRRVEVGVGVEPEHGESVVLPAWRAGWRPRLTPQSPPIVMGMPPGPCSAARIRLRDQLDRGQPVDAAALRIARPERHIDEHRASSDGRSPWMASAPSRRRMRATETGTLPLGDDDESWWPRRHLPLPGRRCAGRAGCAPITRLRLHVPVAFGRREVTLRAVPRRSGGPVGRGVALHAPALGERPGVDGVEAELVVQRRDDILGARRRRRRSTSARRFGVPAAAPSVVMSPNGMWLNALTTFEAGQVRLQQLGPWCSHPRVRRCPRRAAGSSCWCR